MSVKKVSDLVEDYNPNPPRMSIVEKVLLSTIGLSLAFIALKLMGVL